MSIKIDLEIYKKLPELKEVTNSSIFVSTKNEIFAPDGLYSEQIFGPVKDYQCQCGALYGTINKGVRCEKCGVLCDKSDLRTQTFAKITLPNDIYVINPIFIELLSLLMGQYAIKSILSKKIDENIADPYFFSFEKMKLVKQNKMKKNEDYLDIEVYDIATLKQAYDELLKIEKSRKYFEDVVSNRDILDFIFLNEVIVTPPNSRPLIKINNKIILHRMTSFYAKLLNSLKNISDSLYQANTKFFGYTIYKYQDKINEIYEEILESNFTKKESHIRESLIGKTIEFSSRAVIVPNPALPPYTVGIHKEVAQRLFLPEMLNYFFEKYKNDDAVNFIEQAYQLINGDEIEFKDEEFLEFLTKKAKDFKLILERQPVLFKYNTSGVKVGRIFGDDDLFKNKKD